MLLTQLTLTVHRWWRIEKTAWAKLVCLYYQWKNRSHAETVLDETFAPCIGMGARCWNRPENVWSYGTKIIKRLQISLVVYDFQRCSSGCQLKPTLNLTQRRSSRLPIYLQELAAKSVAELINLHNLEQTKHITEGCHVAITLMGSRSFKISLDSKKLTNVANIWKERK